MSAPPDPHRRTLERLYGLERGKSPLGLDGTRRLLDALGHPERAFPVVHLAGTNGKGSTAALLERSLRAAGVTTGLFTSPHLVDFRERIRVDGRAIAAAALAGALDRVAAAPGAAGHTFFEVTFALACLRFAGAGVGCAVLETGLGGRLDSTNVVDPALCVLTPIGLDHQEMLGPTLAAIAGEKAGILKPGVPAVSAAQPRAAAAVLARRAARVGAPLERAVALARLVRVHAMDEAGADVTLAVRDWGRLLLRLALRGRHQLANAVTAAAAFRRLADAPGRPAGARLDARALAEGLARARWPGRFEPAPAEPRLWWDGAHNPAGAAALRAAWRDVLADAPGALVLGLSADKDVAAFLAALAGPWRTVHAVAADSPRALAPGAVAERVRAAWPGVVVREATSVAAGVRAALADLAAGERALLTGSLFVVGEAMAALGAEDLECV